MSFEEIGEFEDLLTRVIRDSDKMDIYNVISNHLDIKKQTDEIILHLPDTEEYSAEIIKDIYEGRTIDYARRRTFNDMKLTILNWIQDLNFGYSYRHILEKDYINIFCDTLPDNGEMHKIRNFFTEYAEERA